MANLVYPESRELCSRISERQDVSEYLSALKMHNFASYAHSKRVAELCTDIVLNEPLGENNLFVIGKSGLLHDIGKKDTPLEILTKPDNLTDDEMKVMKGHVRKGYIAIRGNENHDVRAVIAAHHEFQKLAYPRSGYDRRALPREGTERRCHNEVLCWLAQILAVSDICDALASPRPYKDALPKDKVEEILRTEFTGDPKLIDHALLRL